MMNRLTRCRVRIGSSPTAIDLWSGFLALVRSSARSFLYRTRRRITAIINPMQTRKCPRSRQGREIPDAPFKVFLSTGTVADDSGLDDADLDAAVQTVIDTFIIMLQHRAGLSAF